MTLISEVIKEKKVKKTRAPRLAYNKASEVMYYRGLLSVIKDTSVEVDALLEQIKHSGELARNQKAEPDPLRVGDSIKSWWQTMLNNIVDKVTSKIRLWSVTLATKVVKKQADATDEQLAQQAERLVGINIRDALKGKKISRYMDNAIATNVSLIKSIPTKYLDEVETLVALAFQEGKSYTWLQEEIMKLGQSTKKRAKVIARDQMGTVNAKFNEVRQRQLGVTGYIWSTSRDERVRDEHARRHGQRFEWDNPPKGGHAGEDYQCRCVALPDFTDITG